MADSKDLLVDMQKYFLDEYGKQVFIATKIPFCFLFFFYISVAVFHRQADLTSRIGKTDSGNQVVEKLDSILGTRLLKIQMRPRALVPIVEGKF